MKFFIKHFVTLLVLCSLANTIIATPRNIPIGGQPSRFKNFKDVLRLLQEKFYGSPDPSQAPSVPKSIPQAIPKTMPPPVATQFPKPGLWATAGFVTSYLREKWASFITNANFATYRKVIYKMLLIGIPIGTAIIYIRRFLQKKKENEQDWEMPIENANGLLLEAMMNYNFHNYNFHNVISALGHGANPNIQNEKGNTPLIMAIMKGHYEVAKILLQQENIDPNLADKNGGTPLIMAIMKGHYKIAKILLQQENIDPNLTDEEGNTPLHWAVRENNLDIAKELLSRNDINLKAINTNKQTAYQAAQSLKRKDIESLFPRPPMQGNIAEELKNVGEEVPQ